MLRDRPLQKSRPPAVGPKLLQSGLRKRHYRNGKSINCIRALGSEYLICYRRARFLGVFLRTPFCSLFRPAVRGRNVWRCLYRAKHCGLRFKDYHTEHYPSMRHVALGVPEHYYFVVFTFSQRQLLVWTRHKNFRWRHQSVVPTHAHSYWRPKTLSPKNKHKKKNINRNPEKPLHALHFLAEGKYAF